MLVYTQIKKFGGNVKKVMNGRHKLIVEARALDVGLVTDCERNLNEEEHMGRFLVF